MKSPSLWHVGRRSALCLALGTLTLTACSGTGSSKPEVAIAVAPLELPGITDACYTLRVTNGLAETVWEKAGICAGQFGDSRGSISYVGPCDASTGASNSTVTLVLEDLFDTDGTLDRTSYQNPCGNGALAESDPDYNYDGFGPCELTFECEENTDTPVTFNITVMRDAGQGFFDVAVNFEDIFCSAKVDCNDPTTGDPLALLHNPGNNGERDATAVVGFACYSGGAQTILHMEDVRIVCGTEVYPVDPTMGPGNLTLDAGNDPVLFGAAVYEGVEPQAGQGLSYWNVSLGIDELALPASGCKLEVRATASEDSWSNGYIPATHTNYPVLSASVDLSIVAGELQCGQHPINGGGSQFRTIYANTGIFSDHLFCHELVPGAVDLTSTLPDCGVTNSFSGAAGGSAALQVDGLIYSATAPANAFVDGSNVPVTGNISLIVSPDGFAGSYSVSGSGDEVDPDLAVDYTFVDELGNEVQVAAGVLVTIRIPLPPSSLYLPGDAIELYSYDAINDIWVPTATGVVISEGGHLYAQAAVPHFTWYGVQPAKKSCIDVTLVDGHGNPIENTLVRATVIPGAAAYNQATTDASGGVCLQSRAQSYKASIQIPNLPAGTIVTPPLPYLTPAFATEAACGGACLPLTFTVQFPSTCDGNFDAGEVCDGGANCSSTCVCDPNTEPVGDGSCTRCGNGLFDAGEGCDPLIGNGDFCDAGTCECEPTYVGDNAGGCMAGLDGICSEVGDPDCDTYCGASDAPTGPDCDTHCDAGDAQPSPDCNGYCQVGDFPYGGDCNYTCEPSEAGSTDCDLTCTVGEEGSTDCDGKCAYGDTGLGECNTVCQVGEDGTDDCNYACEPGEAGSPDCDTYCNGNDVFPSPDCDGHCAVADYGSVDCDQTCQPGEAYFECDDFCVASEEGSTDCDHYCTAGEYALGDSPDCAGPCTPSDAGTPVCNDICNVGDTQYGDNGPDCDGWCAPGEANTDDCNGYCEELDTAGSPDCNGVCDGSEYFPSPDCNGRCSLADSAVVSGSNDCNTFCEPGDALGSDDCDTLCEPWDFEGSFDCDTHCTVNEEESPDCDNVCETGDTAGMLDCSGHCEAGEDGTTDCNTVCDPADTLDGPDCDGVCDPADNADSVDCNERCSPSELPESPDCDELCQPGELAASPDCNQRCDGWEEVGSAGECNGTCEPGEASPDCDGYCEPGDTGDDCNGICETGDILYSNDCNGVCDGLESNVAGQNVDCNGSCDHDGENATDCDGICQNVGEIAGTDDCDTICSDYSEMGSDDCDGVCQEGEQFGPDCDGTCDFDDDEDSPDCLLLMDEDAGGTVVAFTHEGIFTVTAGPNAFVDQGNAAITGEILLQVNPNPSVGNYAFGGGTLDPESIADIFFLFNSNPAQVANGASVTVVMPLPATTSYHVGQTVNVYYYNGTTSTWSIETTGTVVASGDGLGVSFSATHFSIYAIAASPANTYNRIAGVEGYSTCFLTPAGAIECPGDRTYGLHLPPAGSGFVSLAVGKDFGCALHGTGTITCWGDNSYGQTAAPAGSNFVQISSGEHHTCSLDTNGHIACWGGHPDYVNPAVVDAPSGGVYREVVSSGNMSCALDSAGSPTCWGETDFEQNPVVATGLTQVAAAYDVLCAINSGGQLQCFGANTLGIPLPGSSENDVALVRMGSEHLLVLRNNGTIGYWAANYSFPDYGTPPTGGDFAAIGTTRCAMRTDGSSVCWGFDNYGGQARRNDGRSIDEVAPGETGGFFLRPDGSIGSWATSYPGPSGTGYTQLVSDAGNHYCALKPSNEVVCWGDPVPAITPAAGTFTHLAAATDLAQSGGQYLSFKGTFCGIRTNGTLACWGSNTDNQATPPSGSNFVSVWGHDRSFCAVRAGNAGYSCWGRQGSATVYGEYTIVKMVGFQCILRANGTVACPYLATTGMPTGDGFVDIAAGFDDRFCAVHSSGSLSCWRSSGTGASSAIYPQGNDFVSIGGNFRAGLCGVRSNGRMSCAKRTGFYETYNADIYP